MIDERVYTPFINSEVVGNDKKNIVIIIPLCSCLFKLCSS